MHFIILHSLVDNKMNGNERYIIYLTIMNTRHVLFLFLSLGALFYQKLFTYGNRDLYRLRFLHIKAMEYCLNIVSLIQLVFPISTISFKFHPQDEFCSTKTLNVELGG